MARSYHLGFSRRTVNVIVRILLTVGLSPPHTYLLIVRGRKTGRLYRTPVTLVEENGERWLVAPYGEVGWVKNARAAKNVTLERGNQSETVTLVELPPEGAAPVLTKYLAQVPIVRPFFDVTPQSEFKEFVVEAPKHPVFRILL